MAGTNTSVGVGARLWRLAQMLIAVFGIYFCFGLWSVKQERIMKKPYYLDGHKKSNKDAGEMFSSVFVIGFTQAVAGFLVSVALLLGKSLWRTMVMAGLRKEGRNAEKHKSQQGASAFSPRDIREVVVMGFTNAFGTTLGYTAMRRLSYPVVLTTKMSKMIPVMAVGFLWHGTRYPLSKVCSCLLITGGIVAFYFLEEAARRPRASGGVSSSGQVALLLLFINLVMDGFTNSTQDALVKRRHWSGNQLMMWTNFLSAAWLLLVMLLLEVTEPMVAQCVAGLYGALKSSSGPLQTRLLASLPPASHWTTDVFAFNDLSKTVDFLQRHPEARTDLLEMSLLNGVGQLFVFFTISLFGSLTLTTMTLVRKAGSVVLSIYVHGHVVTVMQWTSLAAVMVGAMWDCWSSISNVQGDKSRVAYRKGRADGHSTCTSADAAAGRVEKGKDGSRRNNQQSQQQKTQKQGKTPSPSGQNNHNGKSGDHSGKKAKKH